MSSVPHAELPHDAVGGLPPGVDDIRMNAVEMMRGADGDAIGPRVTTAARAE